MKNDEIDKLTGTLGTELLSEAASLLLEDYESLSDILEPEEIAEFEEVRRRVLTYEHKQRSTHYPIIDDELPLAAEE